MDTNIIGRLLLLLGITIVSVGILLIILPKIPGAGRLPGDIMIQTGHVKIFAPLATCLILSLLLTLIFNLLARHR